MLDLLEPKKTDRYLTFRFELGIQGILPDHIEHILHVKDRKSTTRGGLMTVRYNVKIHFEKREKEILLASIIPI